MGMKNRILGIFGLQDEVVEEYLEEDSQELADVPAKKPNKVVSLHSQPNVRLILSEPRSYEEAQAIADNLRNRRPVVVNLQRVRHDQALRIVDFLSGTVYALGGQMSKVGPQIFVCSPDNIEIEGTISDLIYPES